MIEIWQLVVFVLSFGISVPLLVVSFQIIVAVFFGDWSSTESSSDDPAIPFFILMPAHNESKIIRKTLAGLLARLVEFDAKKLILLADNCSDNTADIAREFGVTVLERHDPDRRGKGYALQYGIDFLKGDNQKEMVLVLDADCEIGQESAKRMTRLAASLNRPVQAVYIMGLDQQTQATGKISQLAWLLKNKVRLLAMDRLRLPVLLTGSGMVLPWDVVSRIDLGTGSIVEDTRLTIDCTRAGYAPRLCADALVYSTFPTFPAAAQTQRVRWEHGHIETITQTCPGLVLDAWRLRSFKLLALAIDIAVPPLSLMVMIALGGLAVSGFAGWAIASFSCLIWLGSCFLLFALSIALAWFRFGREVISFRELAGIPHYVFSKVSIYAGFILKRQVEWVKTSRDD